MNKLGELIVPAMMLIAFLIAICLPAPKPPVDTDALIAKIVRKVLKKL